MQADPQSSGPCSLTVAALHSGSAGTPLLPPAWLLAGVDEAGRGPLAGPVYAAAVILDPARPIPGIRDSKKLTATQREVLAREIRQKSLSWSVAFAEAAEIDTLNILKATHLAMRRALAGLAILPQHVQVDGNLCPSLEGLEMTCSIEAIVKGDDKVAAIGAASILAKVERDAVMLALHDQYPHYGFAVHKGYPTPAHLAALREHGASPVHRRTFAPVRAAIEGG
jgi:ribonuclease HII